MTDQAQNRATEKFEKAFADKPLRLLALALLINTIALLLSRNYVDGDAHTRTFMALQWLREPFFIYVPNAVTWVFGPLHCYLNAFLLAIWQNPPLAPRVLSLVLTSLTILPLYHSVRIAFGRREALYTAFLFCFFTLFIHPAAIAASEGINLLFVFLSVWLFLRFRASRGWLDLCLTSVAVLAATMTRYESWLLIPFIAAMILFERTGLQTQSETSASSRRYSQALVFLCVSCPFAAMWLISCWATFGDPLHFIHYSGNLDAPVIARKLSQSGAVKLVLYNLAFLPGVMMITFPITTFVAAVIGFILTVRRNRRNIFLYLLAVFLLFYLAFFVFSFQRYPLARFTTLPAAMFFCFAGTGVVYLLDCLPQRTSRIIVTLFLLLTVSVPVGLGFFSRPSENAIAEKLRAVSPLINPPACFGQMADHCTKLLSSGHRLVLDTRNYNDRLLYLSLNKHFDRADYSWPNNDSLRSFIAARQPSYVLYTRFPRNNHELFSFRADSDSAMIAGVGYVRDTTCGLFTLYRLATGR